MSDPGQEMLDAWMRDQVGLGEPGTAEIRIIEKWGHLFLRPWLVTTYVHQEHSSLSMSQSTFTFEGAQRVGRRLLKELMNDV